MLIPPTKVKNPSSPMSPTALVAMIAVCADPKPGRKAATKPMPEAAETDLVKFFAERDNGLEICWGMIDFCRKLSMMIEKPNNPESKGNKGCSRLGMLKTSSPNAPESKNTTKAFNLLPRSFKIM